jgi:hypothetical protein
LTEELSQTNHLVQRLVEANQASTYAASLQADLNKDLLAFSRGINSTSVVSPSVVSPLPAPATTQPEPPKLLKPKAPTPPSKLVRYKKFWSDEGTPGSDVSLTDLPTEEISFIGAAKRISLESRIAAQPERLQTRISSDKKSLDSRITSDEKSLLERLEQSTPYGFDPEFFRAPVELPSAKEEQPNLYRDSRRPKRRH